ncbi:MAG: hypothetical protein ACLFQ8_00695 [Candidatus Aenigmatarchaeota archaeon]
MNKGQTMVVAAILMVSVIIALASGILVFGKENITDVLNVGEEEVDERIDETKASIAINSVSDKIEVMNIGSVELPVDFSVYVDGEPYEVEHTCGDKIEVGERCNLSLPNFDSDLCTYEITIHGPADTWDEVEAGEACD